jgi:hypothetical protein
MPGYNRKPRTHAAYAYMSRRGGTRLFPLECGGGHVDKERNEAHFFIDRVPYKGGTGYFMLVPRGETPPVIEPQPKRPGDGEGDEFADD